MTSHPPHDFRLRAADLIARFDEDLALFRQAARDETHKEGGAMLRREIVARLFRTAHTLKGAAAIFDDNFTARLAHEIENTLHALRLVAFPLDAALLAALGDAMQEAADALGVHLRLCNEDARDALAIESPRRRELEQAAERAVSQLRACARRLEAAMDEDRAFDSNETSLACELPDEWRDPPLDAAEAAHLRQANQDGLNLFGLLVSFDLESFEEDYRRCETTLRASGEIIASRPLPPDFTGNGAPAATTPAIKFALLYAAQLDDAGLARVMRGYDAIATPLITKASAQTAQAKQVERREHAPAIELLRVPLGELDEALYALGELQDKTVAALAAGATSDEAKGASAEAADELRQSFLAVQERLLRLRVAPLEPYLQEAVRAGRVAARVRGKAVEWQITGGDVLLDKPLAEQLGSALVHLVRNAVDHGIETSAARRASGKAEHGTIRVQAHAAGGRVRVTDADDGRGIELERVRQAAIATGIIMPENKLDAADYLRLIFRPGFTTAAPVEDATAISGRGVGLDAAERSITEAGGEIRVRSATGRGTIFEIRLPLTFALVEAHLVHSGAHRYCIPAGEALDTIHLAATDAPAAVARWRERTLPLISLSSFFAAPEAVTATHDSCAVVVRTAAHRFDAKADNEADCVMLIVDECEAPREFLMRGLGAHAPQWYGVTGAAALADGAVALLLDIGELGEARGA